MRLSLLFNKLSQAVFGSSSPGDGVDNILLVSGDNILLVEDSSAVLLRVE